MTAWVGLPLEIAAQEIASQEDASRTWEISWEIAHRVHPMGMSVEWQRLQGSGDGK